MKKQYNWKQYSQAVSLKITKKQLLRYVIYLQKELDYWKMRVIEQTIFEE